MAPIGSPLTFLPGAGARRDRHRSIAPNARASEPMIAETSASMCPRVRKSIACKCANEGARPRIAQRLAAQQGREIGNRLDDCASLEAELLGDLGSAALNPERVQSTGRGAADV